jgi:amyloid beta A4 protein
MLVSLLLICLAKQTFASIIDVFERTNGHEPRIALACGRVPFYIDLETGSWVSDSSGVEKCDENKEDVKKYCQQIYPKLNITNIVEANKPTKINNWCKPGNGQCKEVKKVTPYRCLVNEYEADALMVPNGCKFDHLHDQDVCMTHNQWRKKAADECKRKHMMKLKDYGILLSCKTDYFTGVEFVCCPKRSTKKKTISHRIKELKKKTRKEKNKKQRLEEAHRQSFLEAIRKFMRYMPIETKGCDRSTYIAKQTELEDSHRKQIAAVVNEWDGTEKRYLQLKAKDPDAAEEKMKRTLEVFRQTLAALEKESKDEKSRLRAEHAECINTQISKNKRDAMIAYMSAIQEEPVNAEVILNSVRKFIQVCEHDRVHSLRHFEHVRNQNPQKADSLRGELLQHLKDLNKVVNESMSLLNYLPDIAQQFGLNGQIGGAILKPRLQVPMDDHIHKKVSHILDNAENKFREMRTTEMPEVEIAPKPTVRTSSKAAPRTQIPVEPEPVSEAPVDDSYLEVGDVDVDIYTKGGEIDKETEKAVEVIAETIKADIKAAERSPFAFTIIMGLSGGVLVIMLFIIIAMVMRRRRVNQNRVIVAENDDDREHLVEMQKNGFENPTYKFFYY